LLFLHITLELTAASKLGGYWEAIKSYTGKNDYMALASVGALGFFIVTITSLKKIRRKLSYETWYFIHLLIYGSILMGFWHQIYLGNDFSKDKVAKYFWISLHLLVLIILLNSRFLSLFKAWVNPLRIKSINLTAHDTLEIILAGGRLGKIKAESGQFAMLRFLTKELWYESHPFSLSSAPKKEGIRFTIKIKGDATTKLKLLMVGQKVVVEGPYGAIVKSQIGNSPTLLIAGGVGIAPIRALLEDFTPANKPHVIFRVKTPEDIVHLAELEELCARNDGTIEIISGPTRKLSTPPFSPENLLKTIPNLTYRQAILCGPESMIISGVRGLIKAGVPFESIHYERSWW
jgi:predicted ferric reductase